MKLFAPRNDWSMTSPAQSNWWNMAGGVGTSSGIVVNESTAMTFSGVFAALRVISETLASLPCAIVEQKDARTTRKAVDHPLWQVIHDQPNPEQDIMSFIDSQVCFQAGWGNAYAEKQYDSLGNIIALWGIHPSRIPLRNIQRNGTTPPAYDGIVAGKPGELVYYVNNDDGSATPIPASDMFHVPGVLSSNGYTGQSIIKWGANSIGIAIATETHAGAVFRNGAVTNMAIKSPKIVGPETAERLRLQWQKTFGGVQNHYKTLLLEDGMEAVPINMDPEAMQMIAARQFSITEIARWFRLPPHLLADLSQASFSNIEAEGLSFIVYSMLPWITRWEKAMQRQLLRPEEKTRYRFKFNVNGLLRGDQAARGIFYQTMFNLGAYSPNDIRGLEDENPIDGGDQYFVQGNNAVPLDKIGELTQANIDKAKAPAPQPAQSVVHVPVPVPDQADAENKKAHLAELRQQMADMIAKHETELPEQVARAVNTRSADEAGKREQQAEQAMQAVRDALQLAVQGEVGQMVRYESRATKDAAKKPLEFPEWRVTFYSKFAVKMTAAIAVFVPAAEKIGVMIDAGAVANAYASESIASLEPADAVARSEFESCVDLAIETWNERPKQLAESLFRSVA